MTHNKASGSEGLSDAIPNLWPVIFWLEGGCNPRECAKELRIYAERIDAARKIAASTPPLSEGAGVKEPSVTDMQFRLIDAKNALQHAADTAAPEVAKVYRQRASEVAVVISALSAASTPSGSEGAGTTPSRALLDEFLTEAEKAGVTHLNPAALGVAIPRTEQEKKQ